MRASALTDSKKLISQTATQARTVAPIPVLNFDNAAETFPNAAASASHLLAAPPQKSWITSTYP
jgi:hypothetical protein